jgi:hypothetical protein
MALVPRPGIDRLQERNMRNSAWEALLRHIPVEQHNQFTVVTSAGIEIAVQGFLRIESDMVILKGRLSGSQDQGRLFFIPFDHLDYLGTSKMVKDAEFEEMFGSLKFPDPAPAPLSATPQFPEPAPVPLDLPVGNGNGNSSPSGTEQRPTIRSEVLERFRNSRPTGPTSLPE